MTPTFWEVLYPFYQRILQGAVPTKDEVKSNVKVAYQMGMPRRAYALSGNDAHLLQGLYCDTFNFFQETFNNIFFDCTKTWVPSTGRYYIVPILPIYADADEVLPEATVLNDFSYFFKLLFINKIKVNFFNKRYEQTYEGSGTLFDINDTVYFFNNHENKTIDSEQNIVYTLPESGLELEAQLVAHTYGIVDESEGEIDIEICNLRLDTDDVCAGLESEDQFMREYAAGGKRDNPADFRQTVVSLTGFDAEPAVTASGTNGATLKKEWNAETKTLILTVISNGMVTMNIKEK
jgi:hypothetical protein